MITIKDESIIDNFLLMRMYDEDKLIGEGWGEIKNSKLEILDILEHEPNVALSLGKALLNSADLKGIKTAICSNEKLEKTLTMLRFKKDSDIYTLSLEGYFTCGCCDNK